MTFYMPSFYATLKTYAFIHFALIASLSLLPVHAYGQNDTAMPQTQIQDREKFISLKGATLKAVYHKQTHIGEYRDYRERSKTYKFTEFHDTKGRTVYKEGDKTLTGVWELVGEDKICYRYPLTLNLHVGSNYLTNGTHCFLTYKLGECYYGFSPHTMTLKGPRSFDDWNSRSVINGRGLGQCGDALG